MTTCLLIIEEAVRTVTWRHELARYVLENSRDFTKK
jgi:hypothetical protein